MKRKLSKFLAIILTLSFFLPSLTVFAAKPKNPFQLSEVEKVSYRYDNRLFVFTEKETVNQIVRFLNRCGAKKTDVNFPTTDGVYVTVYGKDWDTNYIIQGAPYQKEKSDLVFNIPQGYQTKSDMGELIDLMQDKMNEADPYGYFTKILSDVGLSLLNNTDHQSVIFNFDNWIEIAQALQNLNAKKIGSENKAQLGKLLGGTSEIRFMTPIEADVSTYSYRLYEKGIAVTQYLKGKDPKTEYFLCDLNAHKKLYSLMQSIYQNNRKHAAWLTVANTGHIEDLQVTLWKQGISNQPLYPSYFALVMNELKEIQVNSLSEKSALWSKPDAEYRFRFTTGVEYRVQILGSKMRIYASDMENILEYSLNPEEVKQVLDFTARQIQNSMNGEVEVNPVTAKPVIYLYPQKETQVNVKLDFNGNLSSTYPLYPKEGWTVKAEPNGNLTDKEGRSYRYLFWEGVADVNWKQESGFLVKSEEAQMFLEKTLTHLGLNELEQNDFITYWLPKLQSNQESFISFATQQYTDAAKLTVTPKPDSVLRVQMLLTKVDEHNREKYAKLPKQKLPTFDRKGFVVVEWGGTDLSSDPEKIN